MKHKDIIHGIPVEMDDGDKYTDDITYLHGKFAEENDDRLVEYAMKILKDRGYKVIKDK